MYIDPIWIWLRLDLYLMGFTVGFLYVTALVNIKQPVLGKTGNLYRYLL